ncbi:hypothetical protein Taro_038318 [Colocasia esculenta]|uniref:TmcA/NAT10 N-terminal domain-containing protein n=1 Tax=Colocasia esculenta TaxID=4460 RepID=A0A843W7W0_COLES|nr:hypothetical protein [Colocasia esculenta]
MCDPRKIPVNSQKFGRNRQGFSHGHETGIRVLAFSCFYISLLCVCVSSLPPPAAVLFLENMRKKVDDRIRTLIDNGVKLRHRSMFVIVGDKSRDQIVNLHYMLTKASLKSRPSVLWCYKDKLELSSHKKKRVKQVKKLIQRGLLDPEKADPFSLFLESGGVQFCLYKDSERVLGNTFGMCILQDFEALTPNILARTIETVEGGGLVILLLRSLPSLTSLFTMVMDVHERFRTEFHTQTTARFNERFLLSLASCKACVLMDDELNILPISSHIRSIKPVSVAEVPK